MHIIFKNYCYRRCPNLAKRSTRGSPDLRCATCGFYYANKSSLNAHVSYFTYHLCAYRIFKCFVRIRFRKRNVFFEIFSTHYLLDQFCGSGSVGSVCFWVSWILITKLKKWEKLDSYWIRINTKMTWTRNTESEETFTSFFKAKLSSKSRKTVGIILVFPYYFSLKL